MTDSAQEAPETHTWLEFALKCKYVEEGFFKNLNSRYEEIFAMLNGMERRANSFCKG